MPPTYSASSGLTASRQACTSSPSATETYGAMANPSPDLPPPARSKPALTCGANTES